jgi:hypothetical protein
MKKISKKDLFTPGMKVTETKEMGGTMYGWRMIGGHMGARIIDTMLNKARALGLECFLPPAYEGPVTYRSEDHSVVLTVRKHYARTASKNMFTAALWIRD